MANDTLFNAIVQIDIKDIENISIEGYVKAMLEIGQVKNRADVIRHIEKYVLSELITLEEYEKCAWLKKKLDDIKVKIRKK